MPMLDETRSRRVTPELRRLLKEPLGRLYRKVADVPVRGRLVSVGDITSYEFLRLGRVPDVVVYDGRKERTVVPEFVLTELEELCAKRLDVANPAGTLAAGTWRAMREALEGQSKVRVKGEEDLLVLPAVMLASEGTTVCYGQPGKGVVCLVVDGRARKAAEAVILKMEEMR